jgi:N-acetylneuraminate synthase
MPGHVKLGDRFVGAGQPALIVAELSANHGGSLDRALELIRLAHTAGASAIKLQTYRPETMTIRSDRAPFRIEGGLWDGRMLWDLYEEAHTPWEWHGALFEQARQLGMLCFSTPFDSSAVSYLEQFDPPCYKIASFELTDLALLRCVAETSRPVILSTGMATLEEIDEAIDTLRAFGTPQLIALLCVSAYPAPADGFRLKNLAKLSERYGIEVGLSDHSAGHLTAVAATALGARVIEKHLCRSRAEGGPDAAFSAEPVEFADMVRAVRTVETMLQHCGFGPGRDEQASLAFRRSLFAVEDIRPGELFSEQNVRVIRPGHGLPPRALARVIGQRATQAIARGTPLSWELVGDPVHS